MSIEAEDFPKLFCKKALNLSQIGKTMLMHLIKPCVVTNRKQLFSSRKNWQKIPVCDLWLLQSQNGLCIASKINNTLYANFYNIDPGFWL